MDELSHVGLTQCFFCLKDKDLVINTRLRKTLPRQVGIVDMEPCNECRSLMEKGIIVISVRDGEAARKPGSKEIPSPYRTGGWWVVRDQMFERMAEHNPQSKKLCDSIIKSRWTFIEDSVCKLIGLKFAMSDDP